jgi:hypothetical protein
MVQQSVLNRINFLQGDIANLNLDLGKTNDGDVIGKLQEQIRDKEIRIDENKQWLRVLEKDPGYGTLENVSGSYIPKMPKFNTQDEVQYALDNPQHFRVENEDTTEQNFLSTREMVKRHHNTLAIQIAAEERDAGTEEALVNLQFRFSWRGFGEI